MFQYTLNIIQLRQLICMSIFMVVVSINHIHTYAQICVSFGCFSFYVCKGLCIELHINIWNVHRFFIDRIFSFLFLIMTITFDATESRITHILSYFFGLCFRNRQQTRINIFSGQTHDNAFLASYQNQYSRIASGGERLLTI